MKSTSSILISYLLLYSSIFVSFLSCSSSVLVSQDRILGGYEATIEDVPFQLALEGGNRHLCGGSILTRVWALTAAHCVYDQPVRWLSFRAGSSFREKGGTVHPVKYYVYHEQYKRNTLDYDVAVVRVRVPFEFRLGTYPILLPRLNPVQGESVTVTGWGFMDKYQVEKPKQLTAADLFVKDWNDCKHIYPSLTPRMLCAGDAEKNICNGDSGGPLVRGNGQQVGIVSWAYKCGDGLPSVYTNLSAVQAWIRTTTGIEEQLIFPN